MKTLFTIALLSMTLLSYGQTLIRAYVEGININTSKINAISVTGEHLRKYIELNRDNVQATLKKSAGIKLTKKNLTQAIDDIEAFMVTDLMELDNWGDSKMYDKYGISLSRVLGYELKIPGFSKANTDRVGRATVNLSFKHNKISYFSASLNMTKDNKNGIQDLTLRSGFPYSNNTIDEISRANAQNMGKFTTKASKVSFTDAPTTYYQRYFFLEDDLEAEMELVFGLFYQKVGTFDERPAGNQLNSVILTINRL